MDLPGGLGCGTHQTGIVFAAVLDACQGRQIFDHNGVNFHITFSLSIGRLEVINLQPPVNRNQISLLNVVRAALGRSRQGSPLTAVDSTEPS